MSEMARIMQVSIHVPARGTTQTRAMLGLNGVFQSTFPRGERRKLKEEKKDVFSFNPRSREGNDMYSPQYIPFGYGFNPRSREGNDDYFIRFERHYLLFQSTFPRGERPYHL